jgi:hypothetical protein
MESQLAKIGGATMKRNLALVLAVFGSAIVGGPTASGQDRQYTFDDVKAYQILGGLAKYAHSTADDAARAGRQREAAVWQMWEARYAYDAKRVPETMSGKQMLATSVEGNRRMAALFRNQGRPAYANLYAASAVMMQDLASQLRRGPYMTPKFPREMLVVLDNAPGTPWEYAYAVATLPTSWSSLTEPGVGEKVCPTCNGARQWRCPNCLGGGSASYLKPWTGNPVSDTGFSGPKGFLPHSCYNCNGTGWVKCGTCNGRGVVANR